MTLPPVLGRHVTFERSDRPMAQPQPRSIPLSGLAVFAAVLAGVVMAAVGVGVQAGWGWGLAVGGLGLIVMALVPDGKNQP